MYSFGKISCDKSELQTYNCRARGATLKVGGGGGLTSDSK